LRREETTATIPIIMLTGLNSEFTRYAGLESGADEYVTKPASPTQLLPKIQHWLEQSSHAAAKVDESSTDFSKE
jgi:DNA-binding response OmpR family regulator